MLIDGRYEIHDVIGEGGMGFVYRALDLKRNTEVAVKTLKNPRDVASLTLFKKECTVLSSLNHANIVDIRDFGEYDDAGVTRPFLVMPLLPGMTLDTIILKQPARLTPERVIDMVMQVCRGLQAAHEAGVIHRDLKPSNLFIFSDDSVKIIDFGIAHLVDHRSTMGGKGTLEYMSPEQLRFGKLGPESDIFSLGVICFECLTLRRPFSAGSSDEVVRNILEAAPPAISELNAAVPALLSQVVQVAMAKEPVFRYRSAREFAECLQKGLRNESIQRFDSASIAPRLERIRQALEASLYEDAQDLLNAVEAQGYLHPEIPSLRKQATLALRNRRLALLLESAKRLFDKEEYQLVIEKLQRVLGEDPANLDAAKLMAETEGKRQEDQYNKWIRLAEEHLQNNSFAKSREAAEHAREADSTDRVLELLSAIERREGEYQQIRKEKEELFHSALEQRRIGNLTQALEKCQKLKSLNNRVPETSPERGAAYEGLFDELRSERDAIDGAKAEALRLLHAREYAAAQAVCDRLLQKYPRHAVLSTLRLDISERQRIDLSEYTAKVDRDATDEPDLDKKVSLYEGALLRYPDEGHFTRGLVVASERRDRIQSHVKDARNKEERGQYADALSEWENVKNLYAQYPGLELEIERVRHRRDDQAREEAWSQGVAEIRQRTDADEFEEALRLTADALAERPGDPEIRTLADVAESRRMKVAQAVTLLSAGRAAQTAGDLDQAIQEFRQAYETGEKKLIAKTRLIDALVARSRELLDREPDKALELAQEARAIDHGNTKVLAHCALVSDRGRVREVVEILNRSAAAHDRGDVDESLRLVDEGLQRFPAEAKLIRYRETLREAHLERAKALRQSMRQASSSDALHSIVAEIEQVAGRHVSDARFVDLAKQASSEKEQLGKTMGGGAWALAAAAGAGAESNPVPVAPAQGPPPKKLLAPAKPVPVNPATRPARKLGGLMSLPIWLGVAGFSLMMALLAFFAFSSKSKPSVAPAKTNLAAEVVAPPNLPHTALPAVPVRKPGFLINLDGGTVELRDEAGKLSVVRERGTPVDVDAGTYHLVAKDQVGQSFAAKITIAADGQIALSNVTYSSGMLAAIFELRGGQARVFGAKVAGVTRATTQAVPPEGIAVTLPANSILTVGSARSFAYEVSVKPSDRPIIQFHVQDTTKGMISICGLPPGATVDLASTDGKAPPVRWRAGENGCGSAQLQIGQYRASVTADGWAAGQADLRVDFGGIRTISLPMQPLPSLLSVTDAEPGAEVLINETRRAQVGDDGKASMEVPPGNQAIRLRKRNFDSAPAATIKLEPGKPLSWNGAGKLTRKRFEIAIQTTPAAAALFLKRDGKEERLEGSRALLEAGDYWFVARAEGYAPRELSHSVGEGLATTIDLPMTRLPGAGSTPQPVAKLLGIECLKDPVAGCGPFPGSLEFTAKLKKSLIQTSRTFEWQLETKSAGRQTFRLERGKLSFGKEKRSHNVRLEDDVTVSCDVQARSVQCRLNRSVTVTIPSDVDLTGSRLVPGDFKSLSVAPMAK